MRLNSLLLCGAVALSAIIPAGAQTARDYARYSTFTAPRAQGQNVNGMHIFLFAGLKSHGRARMIIPISWTPGPSC